MCKGPCSESLAWSDHPLSNMDVLFPGGGGHRSWLREFVFNSAIFGKVRANMEKSRVLLWVLDEGGNDFTVRKPNYSNHDVLESFQRMSVSAVFSRSSSYCSNYNRTLNIWNDKYVSSRSVYCRVRICTYQSHVWLCNNCNGTPRTLKILFVHFNTA